jgi:hypothetical protein
MNNWLLNNQDLIEIHQLNNQSNKFDKNPKINIEIDE